MPHRPVIDGFEFARAGSRLSGDWPVSDFPRLKDALFEDSGTLHYELLGVPEAQGRPALHLSVRGTLRLTCQRCLGALDYDLRAQCSLLLYPSEAEMDASAADPEGPEKLVGGKEMAVHDLIEDEVLLSVPYAPRHEQCAVQASAGPGGRQTPFADLRERLGGRRR